MRLGTDRVFADLRELHDPRGDWGGERARTGRNRDLPLWSSPADFCKRHLAGCRRESCGYGAGLQVRRTAAAGRLMAAEGPTGRTTYRLTEGERR
jgi:hypothetical protein